MIEDRLHKQIIERIADDEYFTRTPQVLVIAQEEPDGDADDDGEGGEAVSENADPAKRIQRALNETGLVIEVLYPDWERAKGGLTTFNGLVHIQENRTQNRKATTGARRRGRNASRVVATNLDGFLPQSEGSDPIPDLGNTKVVVTGKEFLGCWEGSAYWEIRWELQTRIESLQSFLADESDNPLGDDSLILAGPTIP